MMKTTREKIEVMEAFARGEKLQFGEKHDYAQKWEDVTGAAELSWDWIHFDYRVAPKPPREFWANEYGTHIGSLFPTEAEAKRVANYDAYHQYKGTLHLVEKL